MSDALAKSNPDAVLYSPEGLLTAAVMNDPKVYASIKWVDADVFEHNRMREVYVAMEWVLGKHPDLTSDELMGYTKNVLIEYEKGEALGLMVRMIGANTAVGAEADRYARLLWERWQQTKLRIAATKMNQIVNSSTLDLDEQVDMIEQTWVEALEEAHAEPGWKPIEGLELITDFMAKSEEEHEWVVPGMIEREERFMVIAPEKAGKSVLTRQFCLLLGSGRHPFNPSETIEAMTTLMVDLENPGPVARRDYRRQINQLEGLWQEGNERTWIWHRPGGIHLGDKRDRVALRNVMDRVEPDLLAIAPVYKAYDGLEESWEKQAHGVQAPLDKLRQEFNCAIWMEHHAPWGEKGMREIRAIGSSRWARWLDYTATLVPHGAPPYQMLTWRSVRRDERKMSPRGIRRGNIEEPSWVPLWEEEEYGYELARYEAEA